MGDSPRPIQLLAFRARRCGDRLSIALHENTVRGNVSFPHPREQNPKSVAIATILHLETHALGRRSHCPVTIGPSPDQIARLPNCQMLVVLRSDCVLQDGTQTAKPPRPFLSNILPTKRPHSLALGGKGPTIVNSTVHVSGAVLKVAQAESSTVHRPEALQFSTLACASALTTPVSLVVDTIIRC